MARDSAHRQSSSLVPIAFPWFAMTADHPLNRFPHEDAEPEQESSHVMHFVTLSIVRALQSASGSVVRLGGLAAIRVLQKTNIRPTSIVESGRPGRPSGQHIMVCRL
jgi:hypothetical protein